MADHRHELFFGFYDPLKFHEISPEQVHDFMASHAPNLSAWGGCAHEQDQLCDDAILYCRSVTHSRRASGSRFTQPLFNGPDLNRGGCHTLLIVCQAHL